MRNFTRLRRAERHKLDAPLLVLKLVDRIEPRLRRGKFAGKRFRDLPSECQPALLVDEALFGVAEVAQQLLEAHPVELAGGTAECWLLGEVAHDLGVGNAEPHLFCALVETRFGDHLTEDAPVEAHGLGLFRRERPAHLAADLLQAIIIGLAELLDLDFGVADLGEIGAAEAAEDVVDAPDRKTEGQYAHNHTHDGAAEPVCGGVSDTSKHCVPVRLRDADGVPGGSGAS